MQKSISQTPEMKVTYHVAASRDGFIAREDGDVSWLDEMNIRPEETGLEEFFRTVGGLVMGRNTYDFVHRHGTWPYESKPTWVCTSRELKPLDGARVTIAREVCDVICDASNRGIEHLWLLGGARLASSFLKGGLITHIHVSEMPIELGAGIPLFSHRRLGDIEYEDLSIVEKSQFREISIVVRQSLPDGLDH